ncbi:hypothetical protein Tco_1411901, partial [Tanacetum coccineum]
MDSDKYLEGQSMQRPPLFESDSFIYWKNRFETYVKSKDLDLWHVITNGDFQPIVQNSKDSKVPLILGSPFLHIADAVIRVKQKQLNLGVGTERMIFHIDSAMKHSYSNDDTCFSIDVIDEILKEDFDALLNKCSEILCSIERTILEEKLFAEFDKFMAMTTDENSESESDTEEPPFQKITF